MPEPSFDVSQYIGENLKYPQSAKERNVQGKVVVKFEVNEAGDVVNARIAQGLDAECDSEALRVIQNMPRWKPGKQNGKPVKVTFTLPLEFMLKTQNDAHD
jgi:protein TonB